MNSTITKIEIEELMELSKLIPLADVRTPAEYLQGHIPGSFNLPIFSDEERIAVGTAYKQQSREAAILLGLDFTGSKWSSFIKQALEFCPEKKIILHCWRGGMRSGAMAWILNLYGFEVFVLEGGYKKYRNFVLEIFLQSYPFLILGGMTGSKKTLILQQLKSKGESIIDLENLAQHQGSAFGSLGYLIQPSQEQFENLLATELYQLKNSAKIWLEDESITIGKRVIPQGIWQQMRQATVYKIIVNHQDRINFLVDEYGNLNKDFLIACVTRISKKLGPQHAKTAIEAITEHRMIDFIETVLVYYDKTYTRGQNSRTLDKIIEISFDSQDEDENINSLIKAVL